jgi:hypothetical protein
MPDYSEEERELLLDFALQLKRDTLRQFLGEEGMASSGTKQNYRDRIATAIKDGTLTYPELVSLLDEHEPWKAQHVYLFSGPSNLAKWRDEATLRKVLGSHHVAKYLNRRLPLILPPALTLSSIAHSPAGLRVTAVQRRDSWERAESLDRHADNNQHGKVQYRAFVHDISRGLVAFDWDFLTNRASLHITRLPSHFTYDAARDAFAGLINNWLDIDLFTQTDLRPAIGFFHRLEATEKAETRSHGIDYTSPEGRRISGRSASATDPLLGEALVDGILNSVRLKGTGHTGNFFFLPNGNELDREVHVVLLADASRVTLTATNSEAAVRYVLRRVRDACG